MRKMNQLIAGAAMAGAMMVSSATVFAATNPATATVNNSTGDIQVLLNKGDSVRISGLDDVNFGTITANPADQGDSGCAYSTSGGYTVQGTSANGLAGAFRMADGGAANFIGYVVDWDDAAAAPAETLTSGAPSATTWTADAVNELCLGGTNFTLNINPDDADFAAVPTGAYVDTLTLLIVAM